ncbi:TonB family protein [Spirosoma gilvum]
MRYLSLLFLILTPSLLLAQQTVYQLFEVDSVAEPRGGQAYLSTFLQVNLRKPIQAEAKGIVGRVTLTGIVETDGSISNVKTINSLRSDCDREAIRIVSLFNAWKPASKGGKAVRQLTTIPVSFKQNTPFVYQNGMRIDFFGTDGKPLLADSSQALYKRITPLDTNQIPTGDVVVYERKNSLWKEYFRLSLIRKKHTQTGSSAKLLYTLGTQNYKKDWEGTLLVIDDDNKRISEAYYEKSMPLGSSLTYYPNGMVAEKDDKLDEKSTEMGWYANGQIKHIKTFNKTSPLSEPEQITALWDSAGRQMVKDGRGWVTYKNREESYSDTSKFTTLTEEGNYEKGFKQGIWIGRYADGSYYYEEQYDKGICRVGKAKSEGKDTVRYNEVMQQPEFAGGMPGLGKFLSANLHYPSKAQRANAEGRVFISFVVCTDGTLCDYEVIKGVQKDLDEEALRVVKEMSGKWKPGYHRGEKVRVKYNLPVNFSLY